MVTAYVSRCPAGSASSALAAGTEVGTGWVVAGTVVEVATEVATEVALEADTGDLLEEVDSAVSGCGMVFRTIIAFSIFVNWEVMLPEVLTRDSECGFPRNGS